jgi:hypothetical protein
MYSDTIGTGLTTETGFADDTFATFTTPEVRSTKKYCAHETSDLLSKAQDEGPEVQERDVSFDAERFSTQNPVDFWKTISHLVYIGILDESPTKHLYTSLEMVEALASRITEMSAAQSSRVFEILMDSTEESRASLFSSKSPTEEDQSTDEFIDALRPPSSLAIENESDPNEEDIDDEDIPDVLGLKMPRKRVLATFEVELDIKSLPKRKPYVRLSNQGEDY